MPEATETVAAEAVEAGALHAGPHGLYDPVSNRRPFSDDLASGWHPVFLEADVAATAADDEVAAEEPSEAVGEGARSCCSNDLILWVRFKKGRSLAFLPAFGRTRFSPLLTVFLGFLAVH